MKHLNAETTLDRVHAVSGLLHEYFEEQAQRRPDHPAVECNGEIVTYAELNARADRLARKLRAEGVQSDALVALYLVKSCDLYAAMLGILKAGAGYVPIDSKFPIGRINSIIEDAGIKIILTDRTLGPNIVDSVAARTIVVDGNDDEYAPELSPVVVTPRDVCYVIYTSGSTGRPKGVVIEHRCAVNFIKALQTVYKIDENDRVYQGFSVAFDASVEEIWAAFSVGATLVVPTEDISRSTFEAAEFIDRERISYFSTVPSFLALMTPGLPSLRTLVLGGEMCTARLLASWMRPGLRILNTYGPTEATVVATALECAPNQPVSIGTPLPGYSVHVLDENLKPVALGETGELYIGGESVARGYLNRPDLNTEKFVTVPGIGAAGRLYRTHDVVCLLDNGQLQFIGRADSQVKIRGFRVELGEIERVLQENAEVRQVAVKTVEIDGLVEIAAYVVLAPGQQELDRQALGKNLSHRVPDYMIPKYVDVLDELPTMTSGKIDRKLLPSPRNLLRTLPDEIAVAETDLERSIVDVWQRILHLPAVSIDHDFFVDLRGHSLLAARIVTEFRNNFADIAISVRDIYEYRTVRKLAAVLAERRASKAAPDASIAGRKEPRSIAGFASLPNTRWLCVALQTLGLLAFYGAVALPLTCGVLLVLQVHDGSITWPLAAEIATIGGFSMWPSWLLLSIALKWIVIGRFKPGRYPVWGLYYFRWWLVTRFQALSWSDMFADTPLMSLYYRAMGAKVGKNANIGTAICAAFDLVSIGNNTSIGPETHALGYKVEDGWLILGEIEIGNDCYIGTHCSLGIDVSMEDQSRLEDLSVLCDGATLRSSEVSRGSPAKPVSGQTVKQQRPHGLLINSLFGLIHLALIYVMGYILILSALPAVLLIGCALYFGGPVAGFTAALAAVPLSIIWYLQLATFIKHDFIGPIKTGRYSTRSVAFLKYWFMHYLMNNTRHLMMPLYATIYMPSLLRLLGAKIGKNVEISTVAHAMPDLLEIGDGSFLADGCIVGGHKIDGGEIELLPNKVGNRTFVGNSALVPPGISLGDDGLIGVLSTPPTDVSQTPKGTRWLGSPSFLLPATQKVSCFSSRQTFTPGPFRTGARAVIDLIRILLPGMVSMTVLSIFCLAIYESNRAFSLVPTLLLTPAFAAAATFINLVMVSFLRHVFMPRFKPVVKPLWCAHVWFNEVVNAAYEAVAGALLAPLLGTPYVAWFLRHLGCKIGKWVFLETSLMSEFDLITIGDRASLNLGSTIQPHLFEDRVMKADTIDIGEYCSVGNMAVVLYGTRMEEGAALQSLSVLMKGEALPPWSRWHGIPSQPYETAAAAPHHRYRQAADAAWRSRRSPRAGRSLRQWLLDSRRPRRLDPAERKGDRTAVQAGHNIHDTAA
jgi:non-ribosomal peptide synthetase-like protein